MSTVNSITEDDVLALTWDNVNAHPFPRTTIVTLLSLYMVLHLAVYRREQRMARMVLTDQEMARLAASKQAKEETEARVRATQGWRSSWARFKYRVTSQLIEDHLWLSVLTRNPKDPFTGTQRLTCICVCLYAADDQCCFLRHWIRQQGAGGGCHLQCYRRSCGFCICLFSLPFGTTSQPDLVRDRR